MIIVLVKYECKENCAKAFLEKIGAEGIDSCSRNESGNIRYDYSFAQNEPDVIFLTEVWADQQSLDAHAKTEHYSRLGGIKADYVNNTIVEKFEATKT